MTLIQIGLVDTTGAMDPAHVQAVVAALNVQISRDLPQFWAVDATVRYLSDPKSIPVGVWPIQLVAKLPPGEGGFHMTSHNQPYAKVIASPGSTDWTVDVSHELIEMLVDPYGNRLQSSKSIAVVAGGIVDGNDQFEYLVEACDPCEADSCAYMVQGIPVSDFITPRFYDAIPTPGTRYSFTGALTKPRQILPGGYISWLNPALGEIQQLQYIDPGSPPRIVDLGAASGSSLRAWIDAKTHPLTSLRAKAKAGLVAAAAAHRSSLASTATARAARYT